MGTRARSNRAPTVSLAALALTVILYSTSSSVAQSCPGDLNGDGEVTIDEILRAVNAALDGCPAAPTPTPQPPCAERLCDNGDGTITDTQTGLMWEKKVALDGVPGGLHDADNQYIWGGYCDPTGAFCEPTAQTAAQCDADKDGTGTQCQQCATGTCKVGVTAEFTTLWDWIAQINSGAGFAGHTDWRVPKLSELVSIDSVEGYAAFAKSDCSTHCSNLADAACSCTKSAFYWSATRNQNFGVWYVDFGSRPDPNTDTRWSSPILSTAARAVRGLP